MEKIIFEGKVAYRINEDIIAVDSYNGIMILDLLRVSNLRTLVTEIPLLFEEFDNVTKIEFTFNDVEVSVTRENSDPELIFKEKKKKMKANYLEYQRKQEAYKHTPEYLKSQLRKQRITKLVEKSLKSEKINFRDEDAERKWNRFAEVNPTDDVEVVEKWCKYMQYLMSKHNLCLAKIAKNALNDVAEDISGAQYAYTVAFLRDIWFYGEDLYKWDLATRRRYLQ